MLSAIQPAGKSLGRFVVLLFAIFLAACVPSGNSRTQGPVPSRGAATRVALLVPGGSGNASEEQLAASLVNAAQLAIRDLNGANIDLQVYNTAANPAQAQVAATRAVNDGAQIILGPVFAGSANAVGAVAAPHGINVLAFSNNPVVAGGNVFILGQTFDNTARRLAGYAVRHGRSRIMVVSEQNTAGELGAAAIRRGVAAAGGTIVASTSYEFSQTGVTRAAPGIARMASDLNADALFLTADTAGALPLLAQLMVENGVDTERRKLLGLTRWDVPPQTLGLPALQGGWFTLPDPDLQRQFEARYQAAYGAPPHPIAGLAYDGIAAIGALIRQRRDFSAASLTQSDGFAGVSGIFRLLPDGSNQRGLAVAEIRNHAVTVIDPAPRRFAGPGF